MKKIRLFYAIGLFFFLSISCALAQTKHSKLPKWHHQVGLAVGIGNKEKALAAQWATYRNFGKKQAFKAGLGLRFTHYRGKERDFTSAPWRLAYTDSLRDTLRMTKPALSALNLGLYFNWDIASRWTLGLNFDIVGLSLGKYKEGVLYAEKLDSAQLTIAKPTAWNLQSFEANALGSLNAELYIEYHFSQKLRFKVGMQRFFAEYKTPQKWVENNDRFRRIAHLLSVGITWTPFTENIKCPKRSKGKVKKLREGDF